MKIETHECNKKSLIIQKENYHYLESGLPSVYLRNVTWYKCGECERTEAIIPRIGQLHRCIAWRIIRKPSPLKKKEVEFLIKMMGIGKTKFADMLGIKPSELHHKATSTAIRLFYLAFKNDEYTGEVHKVITREIRKFELLRKAAHRPSVSDIIIDPNHCEKEQEISEFLEV